MATTFSPAPAPVTAPVTDPRAADDDANEDHIVQCHDHNTALCGKDISTLPWVDESFQVTCVTCDLMWRLGCGCRPDCWCGCDCGV
jgi:hypothetical protein